MPFTLDIIPGFADLPDASIAHDDPVVGIHLNKIAQNASFGMADFEVFSANYKHGETIPLPTSSIDGYPYSRSELTYCWGVISSLNPGTQWTSGLDSLWYGAWNVKNWDDTVGANNSQAGLVECIEWYRRSGNNANPSSSSDGTLFVTTVAQRLRTSIIIQADADTYTDIADGDFSTDAAFTESMVQTLNQNAKFAVAQAEAVYMGEFTDGNTIPRPVSLKDGYEYSYSQVKFHGSWRWTTSGSTFGQPNMSTGQLGPMIFSINAATGDVDLNVYYVEDPSGTLTLQAGFGRIAVVAFCSRNNLIPTFGAVADDFAEIDQEEFFPGEPLKAPTLLQLNKNNREAALNVEFFGPTEYADNTTITLPVSPNDGYTYTRDECHYVVEWSDTTPDSGNNLRVVGWKATVSAAGNIAMNVWRLPPGEKFVIAGAGEHMRLRVITIAARGSTHSTLVSASSNPPADGGPVADQGSPGGSSDGFSAVVVDEPYQISYYSGPTGQPGANAILLRHNIGGLVNTGATFPAGLAGTYVGCTTAPTADYVITIKQATTTVGTFTIAAGATTGTISFTSNVDATPGEIWDFIGQATPDTTIAGIYFSMAGRRSANGSTTTNPTTPTSPGVGLDDMLDWMIYADRANTHFFNSSNPIYAFASGNKLWWLKGSAGHPWDLQLFDSSYVYLWITENGDEGAWSNASAYKRFGVSHGYPTAQGVPMCPRFFNTSGSAVTIDSPSPNNIHRTLSCESDGEPLINIGAIRCVTNPPTSIAHGGDVGTQPTIVIEYFYGSGPYNSRERFFLVKNIGLVKWDVASGTYPSTYTVGQTSLYVDKTNGGAPAPYFPCSSGASWWI